jgi:HD domain/GAF domain
VHPEVDELRPKLKEVLYDCAVEIKATKAALYLYDGEARNFELVTEYGFRGQVRQSADFNDPVIDRCGRGRTPFFINGVGTDPRFSELLYASATDRILAAPVYLRGQLVGAIDMRDKASKQPFEQPDVPKAQTIADRIATLFVNKNVFGQRFIALSDVDEVAPVTSGLTDAAPAKPQPQPQTAKPPEPPKPKPEPPPRVHVPRLATLVLEARTAASRVVVEPQPPSISEAELAVTRDILRAILLIPGASVAAFSAYGHMGGVQEVAAKSTMSDDATNLLASKLNIWLTRRGEAGGYVRTSMQTPFGTSAPPITAAQLQKVFTAPVVAGSMRGLYLTVGFAAPPDRTTHEMLAALLQQLQLAIEGSMQRMSLVTMRNAVAEKLVEPDFARFPELRRHTDVVVARAVAFAQALGMTPHEVDDVRLTAMVHDCGMRLLDYERLYRKKDITPDEVGILREHVSVGAVLVEPLLGAQIARAVLCHHERVDGRGYPHDLHGEEIPLLSRIVQICDAFVAMTDAQSYQPPMPVDSALSAIGNASGTQFDAALAKRFVETMRGA